MIREAHLRERFGDEGLWNKERKGDPCALFWALVAFWTHVFAGRHGRGGTDGGKGRGNWLGWREDSDGSGGNCGGAGATWKHFSR